MHVYKYHKVQFKSQNHDIYEKFVSNITKVLRKISILQGKRERKKDKSPSIITTEIVDISS